MKHVRQGKEEVNVYVYEQVLTGSFLKKTREVLVRINHRFFQDFHPNPAKEYSGHQMKR